MARCDLCLKPVEEDDACFCQVCGILFCYRNCGTNIEYQDANLDLCIECSFKRDILLEKDEIDPEDARMYFIELQAVVTEN